MERPALEPQGVSVPRSLSFRTGSFSGLQRAGATAQAGMNRPVPLTDLLPEAYGSHSLAGCDRLYIANSR